MLVKESPFYKEIENEFWQHKNILLRWGEKNSYSDIINDMPYPKKSLFRMIDLIEIMDNMISYAPCPLEYLETNKDNFYDYGGEDYKIVRNRALSYGFNQ